MVRANTFRVSVLIAALGASGALAAPEGLPEPALPDDFPAIDIQEAMLGRSLFYDPILSGNQNIACSTCHHPKHGTSDAVSLSIGEGGYGLGPNRRLPAGEHVYARIPRNAPALWNKGSRYFTTMFHDGRLSVDADAPHGIALPLGEVLSAEVLNPLAAQALFPMTSADEMAGQHGENDVAAAVEGGDLSGASGAWAIIAERVEAVPAYREAFDWVIGEGKPIEATDIVNAMGAFMSFEFRSTDSAFDEYLRGDDLALTDLEREGMELFYGEGGCSACHAGTFQTDQQFHAIGMPQIGPGKKHVETRVYADLGRGGVTGDPDDNYKFLTPSLRNVTLTAPYGHAGAYATLEAVIRHHMNPVESLLTYDIEQAVLHDVETDHLDTEALDDPEEVARIGAAVEFEGVNIEEADIPALIAFLGALEDPLAKAGRLGVPDQVFSGLDMDDARLPKLTANMTRPKPRGLAKSLIPRERPVVVEVAAPTPAPEPKTPPATPVVAVTRAVPQVVPTRDGFVQPAGVSTAELIAIDEALSR